MQYENQVEKIIEPMKKILKYYSIYIEKKYKNQAK